MNLRFVAKFIKKKASMFKDDYFNYRLLALLHTKGS